MGDKPTIIARRDARAGRIILNRPQALNALDVGMIAAIGLALERWRDDPDIHLVTFEAAGERAFCAGGDVRSLHEWVRAGDFSRTDDFFVAEYALNRTIARYPKTTVALIDGVWMGGGVGIAVHGRARVVSERSQFAMPEAQIGLFPDVGTSYVLPRLRGRFGLYLGLTGERVSGADACWLGLATHFVPSGALAGLGDALASEGLGALADFAVAPPEGSMRERRPIVDAVFAGDDLDAIRLGLSDAAGAGAEWAAAGLSAMARASPTSLDWTLSLLRAGGKRTFESCQWAELLLTRVAMRHPNFAEGVRALVIDKDRAPRWA